MYITKRTTTRPTATVQFFEDTTPMGLTLAQWIRATYMATGKLLTVNHTDSADKLQRSSSITWDSKESWALFDADPMVTPYLAAFATYCESHGLTVERTSQEK